MPAALAGPSKPTSTPDVSPLASVLAANAFPGDRVFLRCDEVARVVSVTPQHIRNLCADGTIAGAYSISGDRNEKRAGYWRIPVCAYDAWIKRKSNLEVF